MRVESAKSAGLLELDLSLSGRTLRSPAQQDSDAICQTATAIPKPKPHAEASAITPTKSIASQDRIAGGTRYPSGNGILLGVSLISSGESDVRQEKHSPSC